MNDMKKLSSAAYMALVKTDEYKAWRCRYFIAIFLWLVIWGAFFYFSINFLGLVSYLDPSTSIALLCLMIALHFLEKAIIGTPLDIRENMRTLFLKTLVDGGYELGKAMDNQS